MIQDKDATPDLSVAPVHSTIARLVTILTYWQETKQLESIFL